MTKKIIELEKKDQIGNLILFKQGSPIGGTRTAWKIAEKYGIPCFNLAVEEDKNRILKLIK